jgi:predicted anti-sigma-YlaC factor YlaD
MNCRDIDELVPRYLEGEASDEERLAFEGHVASCAQCAESLEAFKEIDTSLVRMKETLPSWKRAEARFMRSTSSGARRPALSLIWNTPVVCGLLFVVLGVVLFIQGRPLAYGMEIVGSRLSVAQHEIGLAVARFLSDMQSLDLAVLVSLCLILTVIPLVAFGFAVQRFGRR